MRQGTDVKVLANLRDMTTRREFAAGTAAVMATTVIEKLFRQLAELKDAKMRGILDEATEGMNPWSAKKTIAFLDNWSLQELRVARARFMALREKAVSSAGSIDVLVTTELIRVMRSKGRR